MTADEVRALMDKRVKPSLTEWCRVHGVAKSHASEFLNGKRLPTTDLLDALGLEWRICRKRSA